MINGLPTRSLIFSLVVAVAIVCTLRQYFADRYLPTHTLRDSSVYQYDRAIRIFCQALGTDPEISTITSELITTVVVGLNGSQGPRTRKRVRDTVCCMMRNAARGKFCHAIGHVDVVKVPPKAPVAWTADEVRRLISTTCQLGRHASYFDAFIRVAWDTGLRKADIERLARPNGTQAVVVYQQKTREPIVVSLRLETVASIKRLTGQQPLRWRYSGAQVYYWWTKLCKRARVPHGGPQRLRRSAATAVELIHPGAATHFLGHKSPHLAKQSYIDPRIVTRSLFQPEEL